MAGVKLDKDQLYKRYCKVCDRVRELHWKTPSAERDAELRPLEAEADRLQEILTQLGVLQNVRGTLQ